MERGSALWFAIGVLAVWRVTHMLHLEHGPWGIVARARAGAERVGIGDLVRCFFCLSLWIALPAAYWLAASWAGRIAMWLALSAGAIIIEVRLLAPPGPRRD